ncbi:MAG TPA: hypothetical protein PKK60_01910 [archaeon]|nr:hypothetical protein [archaeon]
MYNPDDNYNPSGGYYGSDSTGLYSGSINDNMDNPNYDQGYGGNQGKEMLKKFLPFIVIGIVIILIIAGIFWFLGQKKEMTFTITNLDEGQLTKAALLIYNAADTTKPPVYSQEGAAVHKMTLEPGTYRVRAILNGYKQEDTKTVIVNETVPTNQEIELVRDIEATIDIDFNQTSMYAGQILTGSVKITNQGTSIEGLTGELLTKDTTIKLEFVEKAFTRISNNGGQRFLDFTITVPEKITEEKEGESIIRIKGTNIKKVLKIKVYPTVDTKQITISPSSFKNESLESGKTYSGTNIKIKNGNKSIPLNDLKITIIPDGSSPENDARISWFKFSIADSSTPETYNIDTIKPGTDSDPVILHISPPSSAKKGDSFSGTLKMESLSMSAEKTIPMYYKISKEQTAALEFTQATGIKINCTDTECTAENNVNVGTLKNLGNQTVTEIPLTWALASNRYEISGECAWYSLAINTIPDLAGGKNQTVFLNLTPGQVTPNNSILCLLQWQYTDPTNQELVKDEKEIRISIVKKSS